MKDKDDIIKTQYGWISKKLADRWVNSMRHFESFILLATDEDIDKLKTRNKNNEDNRKWAYIYYGNTKTMAYVDNKTMKAYKADGYEATWMEIPKYKFIRWCTSFDL